mgnify:CR=1 FL=1
MAMRECSRCSCGVIGTGEAMANPFLRRATEYVREDESFLSIVSPAPLTTDRPIWFADVLKPHLKGQMSALQCPNDTPGFSERPAPQTGLSYFQTERSSYQYRVRLAGLTPTEFGLHNGGFWHREHHAHRDSNDTKVNPATIWFACDYWNFHGNENEKGARRYVYIDAHVSEFEN